MKKNTTTCWIKKQLEKFGNTYECVISWEKLDEILEMASNKEKRHLEYSYYKGKKDAVCSVTNQTEFIEPEQFFQERFIQEQKKYLV